MCGGRSGNRSLLFALLENLAAPRQEHIDGRGVRFQCAIGLVLPYRESTSILQVSKLAHHSLAFQRVWSQNRLHDPFTKLLKTYQRSVIHQVMGSVDSVRCYASWVLN